MLSSSPWCWQLQQGPLLEKQACLSRLCPSGALRWDCDHKFNCVLFNKESHFPKIGNKWRHCLCHAALLGADSLSPALLSFPKTVNCPAASAPAPCWLALASREGGFQQEGLGEQLPVWCLPPAPAPLLVSAQWAHQKSSDCPPPAPSGLSPQEDSDPWSLALTVYQVVSLLRMSPTALVVMAPRSLLRVQPSLSPELWVSKGSLLPSCLTAALQAPPSHPIQHWLPFLSRTLWLSWGHHPIPRSHP